MSDLTAKQNLHARTYSGAGYTLCGLAEEAGEDPKTGETEAVQFASLGQFVSCPDCKRIIRHCKWTFSDAGKVRFQ